MRGASPGRLARQRVERGFGERDGASGCGSKQAERAQQPGDADQQQQPAEQRAVTHLTLVRHQEERAAAAERDARAPACQRGARNSRVERPGPAMRSKGPAA